MIYQRIREMCKQRGIAITALEKELGFARGSLSKIDKNKPSSERMQKLADYFNVSAEYLLTGEISRHHKEYYLNDETAKIAQEIFEDRDKRILFDAARGSTPEDLRLATEFLTRLKETNRDA